MPHPVSKRILVAAIVGLASVLGSTLSHATPFAIIWPDSVEVTTYPANVGFNQLADVTLLVNRGGTDIGDAELFGATFSAISSDPLVTFHPYVNNPGPPVAPIHPLEAVGSLTPANALTDLVQPTETLRNTYPLAVFGWEVHYPAGFQGTVAFLLTMELGGDVVQYPVVMHFTLGSDFAISYPHASRLDSSAGPTPVRGRTWGQIKRLYH